MRYGKPVRFDYENVFGTGGDEIIPFCLSDKFRRFLLQVAYRGLWSSVWDVELTTEEKSVIENGIRALCEDDYCEENMPVNVTVNPVINVGCGCSDGGGNGGCNYPPGTPVPGTPVNWPLPADDNPIPPVPDIPPVGTEFDPLRCRLANWWWSMMRLHMTTLNGYTLGLQSATTIVLGLIAVLPAGLVARIGSAVLMAIAEAIVQLRGYLEFAELLFAPAIEWWDENQSDVVCYIYNGTNQDAISEYVQEQLFEALETFWTSEDTNPLLRNLLWHLWRSTFVRDSLFGLALNGVVPEDWHPSHATVDCSVCNGGTNEFPPAPESEYHLFVFAPPVTMDEVTPDDHTVSYDVDPLHEYYEYSASWPTNATWAPQIGITCEAPVPGDTFVGIVVRVASLATEGGNDPTGNRVRLGIVNWDGSLDANLLPGDGMAWIGEDWATEFIAWAESYNFTLQALNILNATENEILGHYRRSGVTAPPGTLAGRFEVRFVYRRDLT